MATTTFDTGTVITADWLNDVDEAVYNPASIVLSAENIINVPAGGVAATDVQAAITELDTDKAAKGANSDITSLAGLTTPLTVAQGGTGAATHTSKGVLIGNGTSAISSVAPGTSGNVLTSDGTNWTSSTPSSVSVYTSTEVSLPLNNKIEATHSLGAVPSQAFAILVCKNASNVHGYAIGDEVTFANDTVAASSAGIVWCNSTLVGLSIYLGLPNIPYKNGSANAAIETSYWNVKLRAIKY